MKLENRRWHGCMPLEYYKELQYEEVLLHPDHAVAQSMIPEKHHEVDSIVYDLCSDLLISPSGPEIKRCTGNSARSWTNLPVVPVADSLCLARVPLL